MKNGYTPALKAEAGEEAIEPEIVSGPMPGGRRARDNGENPAGQFRSFVLRLKIFFSAAVVIMALTLIIIGGVLTSTIIGAVLGIPLILVGVMLIWLLVKALTLGGTRNFFVFKRF